MLSPGNYPVLILQAGKRYEINIGPKPTWTSVLGRFSGNVYTVPSVECPNGIDRFCSPTSKNCISLMVHPVGAKARPIAVRKGFFDALQYAGQGQSDAEMIKLRQEQCKASDPFVPSKEWRLVTAGASDPGELRLGNPEKLIYDARTKEYRLPASCAVTHDGRALRIKVLDRGALPPTVAWTGPLFPRPANMSMAPKRGDQYVVGRMLTYVQVDPPSPMFSIGGPHLERMVWDQLGIRIPPTTRIGPVPTKQINYRRLQYYDRYVWDNGWRYEGPGIRTSFGSGMISTPRWVTGLNWQNADGAPHGFTQGDRYDFGGGLPHRG